MKFILNISWIFWIILVWLLTACQKFQKYVFVIKLCVWFRFDMIFVRSPSNEDSDTSFLAFLSRCLHKVLIKMPWSKLDRNFSMVVTEYHILSKKSMIYSKGISSSGNWFCQQYIMSATASWYGLWLNCYLKRIVFPNIFEK